MAQNLESIESGTRKFGSSSPPTIDELSMHSVHSESARRPR